MNEHREEQAAAYALGALPEDERRAFEQALATDPGLQQLVRDFGGAVGELARGLPEIPPPPRVKAAIMKRVHASAPAAVTDADAEAPALPSAPSPSNRTQPSPYVPWLGWAAAAGVAVLLALSHSERNALESRLNVEAAQSAELAAATERLSNELAESRSARARVEQDATRLQEMLTATRMQLADATQAGHLARLQVAHLSSLLQDQPQAMGVSLWNNRTQEGVLIVTNLPLPPTGKTYEVWVIDPATAAPVSAGLLATDGAGRAQILFKPKSTVETAAQFAISLEPAGGSTQAGPTGPVVMAGATSSL